MSDAWAPQHDGYAAPDGVSAGTLLRRAREAAGLHVGALAVALKVPVRKLEALEADRYELLTDAVFVRALASSVCRTLKIDPQPVLERLPQTSSPRLRGDVDGINAPFRSPRDGAAPGWLDQLSRPVFLVVFALLLAALVLILLPTGQFEERAAAPPTKTEATSAAAPALSQPAPLLAEPAVSLPVPTDGATAVVSPMAGAAAPAVSVSAGVDAPASASAAAPSTAASGIVQFRATGPTWVEVTDARGGVAVRKLLAAGESTGVSGVPPLKVTVGRVDRTEVQVRGKPYDLRPVSKDNVARFEVK